MPLIERLFPFSEVLLYSLTQVSGQPVPLADTEAVDEEEEEEREFEQQLSQWKKTEVRQRLTLHPYLTFLFCS